MDRGEVMVSFSLLSDHGEERAEIEITKFVDTDNLYLNINTFEEIKDLVDGKPFIGGKNIGFILCDDSKKALKDGIKALLAILD